MNELNVGFDPYRGDTGALVSEAMKPGFDPYSDTQGLELADTSGLFSGIGNAIKKASRAVKAVVKKAAPVLGPVVDMARTALKSMGPIGMVANGAIGAIGAGLSGKGIGDIALAAATGAAPPGIDRAIQAAADLAKGKPVLNVALGQAVKAFVPGSAERFAFNTATDIMKKAATAVQKVPALRKAPALNIKTALGTARRALASEAQRRAFDSAVGTVARAAAGVPKMRAPTSLAVRRRVGDAPVVMPSAARRPSISVIHPNVAQAVAAIRRTPGLAALTTQQVAKRIGQPTSIVERAIRLAPRRLGWSPVSSGAAAFLRRHVQHAPLAALRDTRGLTADGATYLVEPGDFAGKIAKKIAPGGAENRWPELIAANPQKATVQTNIGKNFKTLFANEKLIVPTSWRKAAAPPLVTSLPEIRITPTPSSPAPSLTPVSATSPAAAAAAETSAVVQAKTILIAWSKTDGLSEAGFPDYGLRPEDMATTFGARDKFVAMAFQRWSNKTSGTSLPVDGELSPALAAALRAWAERRAALPVPLPVTVPGVATTPATPAAPPPTPPAPSTPVSLPPVLAPPGVPTPATPAAKPADVIPFPSSPSSPSSPKTAAKASSGGGGVFPMVAGGVLGGLTMGPIGAIAGAAAGALLA